MAIASDIILGNLGRTQELRELNNNNAVINFSVVHTPRIQENGEWKDGEPIWYQVTLWGVEARNFSQSNLAPGTPLVVIGRRKARRVEATVRDGREYPERVVEDITAEAVSVHLTRFNTVSSERVTNGGQSNYNQNNSNQGNNNSQNRTTTQSNQSTQNNQATQADPSSIFGDDDGGDIFGDGDSGSIFDDF